MTRSILLLSPPLSDDELYARGSKLTASVIPPLGLAYIAAVLEKEQWKVEIIDGIASDITIEDVVEKASSFDYIGITTLSAFVKRCVELIKLLKSAYPEKIIITGGPHTSAMPESLLHAGADYAVIGEGEETMKELLDLLDRGKISEIEKVEGIAFKRNDHLIKTKSRPLIKDLDTIPLPARHLLPMSKYKTSEGRSFLQPSHSLVTSRGCPGTCTFCNKGIFGTRFRINSAKRIVQEMRILKEQYGAREVAFLDDSFTTVPKKLIEVCDLIVKSKINIPWSCEARIDSITEEMLIAMKKAQCCFVSYGVESGCDNVLKRINKRITTTLVEKVFRMTQEIGIPIRAYFMLGFRDETEEEMFQTINFAKKLDPDVATFTLLCPFPGTVDYEKAKAEGGNFDPEFFRHEILPEFNFPKKPIYSPKGISPKRLMEIQQIAYRRFFLRPRFLLKQLLEVRNWSGIVRLSRGFFNIILN